MPATRDGRFAHSVVFICAHSSDGAMGLIVNKPAPDLSLGQILSQLEITSAGGAEARPVHFGGPVEVARGFVLHSLDYTSSLQTLKVAGVGMTATQDILEEIGMGGGPENAIMALGYAGWGAGQLESEIAANGWLTCDSDPGLLFATPDDQKWEAALSTLGVDALTLSATAGRA